MTPPRLYALCCFSAFSWSVIPVALVLGGRSDSVWFQICALSFGYSCFFYIWLRVKQPALVTGLSIKTAAKEIADNKFLLCLQRCGMPCYLLIASYTDPVVAGVIIETWIIWYVSLELRKSDRQVEPSEKIKIAGLLCMGILGVAGVAYSQYGSVSFNVGWIAVPLVILCAATQGYNVRTSLQHGHQISQKMKNGDSVGGAILAVGIATSAIFAISLCVHIGLSISGSVKLLPSLSQMLWSLPVWLVFAPYALMSARQINHIRNEKNVGVNLIYHIAAPMALLWLWAAGSKIYYPQAMIAGTTLIVLSAFLANFRQTAIN